MADDHTREMREMAYLLPNFDAGVVAFKRHTINGNTVALVQN